MYNLKYTHFSTFQKFTPVKKVWICLQLKDTAIRPDK